MTIYFKHNKNYNFRQEIKMALSRARPFTAPAVLASRAFSSSRPVDQKNLVLVDGVR